MSDDLQLKYHDNGEENNIPISPDEGWSKMSMLLDEHIPQAIIPNNHPFASYLISIAAIITFLILSLSLQKSNKLSQPVIPKISTTTAVKPIPQKMSAHNMITQKQAYAKVPVRDSHIHPVAKPRHFTLDSVNKQAAIHDTMQYARLYATLDTTELLRQDTSHPQKAKAIRNNKITLLAGVGINIATAGHQYLQPYPIFEVKYSLHKRLNIAMGIAIYSPLTTHNVNGSDKIVYVNDTLNNVSMYTNKVIYTRLFYIDVPVTASWQLTKNISLEGGLQFSHLIRSKAHNDLQLYDFDMNRVNANINTLTSAFQQVDNNIKINKMDYRMLLGIEYKISNRTSVNLQYQQGIKPVMTGDGTSNRKNSHLTLKLKMKLTS